MEKLKKQNRKSESARTFLGRNYHAKNAEDMKAEIKRSDNVHNANGAYRKLRERYGHGSKATILEGKSKGYARNAKTSKHEITRKYYDQKSKNLKYQSKAARKVASSWLGTKTVRDFINKSPFSKVPYQRLSGRTTTVGKNMIENIFTLGLAGTIKDAKYLYDNRKK